MDHETVQAALEVFKVAWNNLKAAVREFVRNVLDWINRYPTIKALIYRQHTLRQRGGIRNMFRRQHTVHVFHSQMYIKPIRAIARSRC